VLLLATMIVAAAHGQEPRRIEPVRVEGFGVARFGAAGVERIMSLRSELKLTDDQLRQLEEIRKTTRDQIDKILTQEQRDRVRDRTPELRAFVASPRGIDGLPLGRGLRLREELRAAPRLRRDSRLRDDTLNRLVPRFRNLNELTITPRHYYWFGAGTDREARVLRRRGLLEQIAR